MKRIIIAIVIPVICVALGILSFFFVKNTCNHVISGLDDILNNTLTEDAEEVNRLSVQTNLNWHKKVFLMNILIGRNSTSEVDKQLNKMVYFAKIHDFESLKLNCADCKEELLYIIESNEPKLSAIF